MQNNALGRLVKSEVQEEGRNRETNLGIITRGQA